MRLKVCGPNPTVFWMQCLKRFYASLKIHSTLSGNPVVERSGNADVSADGNQKAEIDQGNWDVYGNQ